MYTYHTEHASPSKSFGSIHTNFEKWTHNKTIQKAIESCRVSDEHKAYLKTLREK